MVPAIENRWEFTWVHVNAGFFDGKKTERLACFSKRKELVSGRESGIIKTASDKSRKNRIPRETN